MSSQLELAGTKRPEWLTGPAPAVTVEPAGAGWDVLAGGIVVGRHDDELEAERDAKLFREAQREVREGW
jgi:hypothetical protein